MGGKNKKAAEKVSNAPKKRAGPKGNFLGLRLEYLETELPAYLAHHADGNGSTYLSTIVANYYAKFDWRELDTKINPTDQISFDHISHSSRAPDEDGTLTEEEQEWKAHNMQIINKVSFLCCILYRRMVLLIGIVVYSWLAHQPA